jgi:hypothetical protein
MRNPRTKKNPLMSIWLSAANAVIGCLPVAERLQKQTPSGGYAGGRYQANGQVVDRWADVPTLSEKEKFSLE